MATGFIQKFRDFLQELRDFLADSSIIRSLRRGGHIPPVKVPRGITTPKGTAKYRTPPSKRTITYFSRRGKRKV